MTAPEIIGSLFTAYATGWVWTAAVLYFKKLSEVST